MIEVEEAALAEHLERAFVSDSAVLELRTLASSKDLNGVEELEAELRRHLDDLKHSTSNGRCSRGSEMQGVMPDHSLPT